MRLEGEVRRRASPAAMKHKRMRFRGRECEGRECRQRMVSHRLIVQKEEE